MTVVQALAVDGPPYERGSAMVHAAIRFAELNCTNFFRLIMAFYVVIKEVEVDLRQQLMEGLVPLARRGSVVPSGRSHPPFVVLDGEDAEVGVVAEFLRDLALGDASPLTCRSYAYELLRWFRLLWMLELAWQRATESDVAVLVGWMRSAPNPQRRRLRRDAAQAGSVNVRTGKQSLAAGVCAEERESCAVGVERVLRLPRPSRSRAGGEPGPGVDAATAGVGASQPDGDQAGGATGPVAAASGGPAAAGDPGSAVGCAVRGDGDGDFILPLLQSRVGIFSVGW